MKCPYCQSEKLATITRADELAVTTCQACKAEFIQPKPPPTMRMSKEREEEEKQEFWRRFYQHVSRTEFDEWLRQRHNAPAEMWRAWRVRASIALGCPEPSSHLYDT